jgi:hypothetical protein
MTCRHRSPAAAGSAACNQEISDLEACKGHEWGLTVDVLFFF